jgi:Yip1 domain
VSPTESVRPLRDVWLRPRRVFRELSPQPLSLVDYLLAAAQGVATWLGLARAQDLGASKSAEQIIVGGLIYGPLLGIATLLVLAAIYARLGRRNGAAPTLAQMFHVLAYGGVPLTVSLGIWLLTALAVGGEAFVSVPRPETEAFAAFLLQAQLIVQALLFFWSVLLQAMGLSELHGLSMGRAFWIWLLGQFLGALAMALVAVLLLAAGLKFTSA